MAIRSLPAPPAWRKPGRRCRGCPDRINRCAVQPGCGCRKAIDVRTLKSPFELAVRMDQWHIKYRKEAQMRWKNIKEDATARRTPPPGWAEELERGLDDVRRGRVVPVGDVIGDLDTALAEMANDEAGEIGHGENITDSTMADQRSQR